MLSYHQKQAKYGEGWSRPQQQTFDLRALLACAGVELVWRDGDTFLDSLGGSLT